MREKWQACLIFDEITSILSMSVTNTKLFFNAMASSQRREWLIVRVSSLQVGCPRHQALVQAAMPVPKNRHTEKSHWSREFKGERQWYFLLASTKQCLGRKLTTIEGNLSSGCKSTNFNTCVIRHLTKKWILALMYHASEQVATPILKYRHTGQNGLIRSLKT